MHLRSRYLLTIALIGLALQCCGQTGTVTFYSIQPSAGAQARDAFVPFGQAPFTGLLYDGAQRMAHAARGRFMSFRLPVGEHQFSASYHSLGPSDPAVRLNVEDGGCYCVRLSANYKSGSIALPVAVVHSVIEQVPCDEALKEAGKYKPLQPNRIDPAVRVESLSSQSFPKHD
jgi:hypothetical protein